MLILNFSVFFSFRVSVSFFRFFHSVWFLVPSAAVSDLLRVRRVLNRIIHVFYYYSNYY